MCKNKNKISYYIENIFFNHYCEIVIERYKIIDLIGHGSQAYVYKAYDLMSDEHQVVALKIFNGIEFMQDDDISAIQREFTLLQSLNHQNILQVYSMHMTETLLIISMELIEGYQLDYFVKQQTSANIQTALNQINPEKYKQLILYYQNNPDLKYIYQSFIRAEIQSILQEDTRQSQIQYSEQNQLTDEEYQIIYKHQKLSPVVEKHKFDYTTELTQIFTQICDALTYLEEKHIQHNDLKVQNIMLTYSIETQKFIVKIIDFGLSVKQTKKTFNKNYLQGTLGYISPDIYEYFYLTETDEKQLLSKKIDARKEDIYALGGILFFMLTGYQPFISSRDKYFNLLQIKNSLYLPLDLCIKSKICAPYFSQILDDLLQPDSQKRLNASQIKKLFLQRKKIYDNNKSHQIKFAPIKAIGLFEFLSMSGKEQDVPVIRIKICMIGEYKIGKSRFCKQLSNNKQLQIINHQNQLVVIHFADTHGTEGRRNSIIGNACEDLDVAILCSQIDQTEIDDLKIWKNIVQSFSQNCNFVLVLFDEYIKSQNNTDYIEAKVPDIKLNKKIDIIAEDMPIFYYSTIKYSLTQFLHGIIDIVLESNDYKIQMMSTKFIQQYL